jgi:hypothetical protein
MTQTDQIRFRNIWTIRCWKDRAAFERRAAPLWDFTKKNFLPNEALVNVLGASYLGTAPPTWYVGIVDAAGFSGFIDSDTAAQIGGSNGWAEWIGYSEATRQALVLGAVTTSSYQASVDNSASQATFTINAAGSLEGSFLSGDSTKGGTSSILGAEVDFDTGVAAVSIGNIVQVTVILQAYSG